MCALIQAVSFCPCHDISTISSGTYSIMSPGCTFNSLQSREIVRVSISPVPERIFCHAAWLIRLSFRIWYVDIPRSLSNTSSLSYFIEISPSPFPMAVGRKLFAFIFPPLTKLYHKHARYQVHMLNK